MNMGEFCTSFCWNYMVYGVIGLVLCLMLYMVTHFVFEY